MRACVETNVATQETPSATSARIHEPHGNARRAKSDRLTATQGKAPASSLASGQAGNRLVSESLNRDERLRRKSDFLTLRQRGNSRAHPLLVLRAVPNTLAYTRFGFVVSKRVSVKAVDRNRIRRRLKEIIRLAPIRQGWDQLLIARKPIVEADFQAIRGAVLDLEKRLNLLEELGNGQDSRKGVK